MLLAIDAGNTRIKYAVFEYDMLLDSGFLLQSSLPQSTREVLQRHKKISDVIVVSVGVVSKADFFFLNTVTLHFITINECFPFTNKYESPETVGTDRLLLATGAVLQFPAQNRLVIDAGTCITYDFTDAENNYLGGAISPGIRLRYESLHQYTAKLPLLSLSEPEDFIGHSTTESIHSGVINGVVNEIDGFINMYAARYPNFIIILTGGDAVLLSKRLKNTIFANSNFLLNSLNSFFQYKINK